MRPCSQTWHTAVGDTTKAYFLIFKAMGLDSLAVVLRSEAMGLDSLAVPPQNEATSTIFLAKE